MKESFEVKTYWGWFRLDRAAYEDYLAGKLWISWAPGQRGPQTAQGQADTAIPSDVSAEAIRLRDTSAKQGLYLTLQISFPNARVEIPYQKRMQDRPIDELPLSVRSSNALMRAHAGTFGRVWELLAGENGLLSVRNLGVKSEAEIRRCFLEGCYACLTPAEQAIYWQTIISGETREETGRKKEWRK